MPIPRTVLLRASRDYPDAPRQLELETAAAHLVRRMERPPSRGRRLCSGGVEEGHAIIAFRNRLIHTVDPAIAWNVIELKVLELELMLNDCYPDEQ